MNRFNLALNVVTALVLVVIIVPILVVVFTSFSAGESFYFPPPGFSLRWFREFFHTPSMTSAFVLSILLALSATTTATVLGTLGALFVTRRRGVVSNAVQLLFMAPLVFPTLILGLALLLFYRTVEMPILPGLFLAHVVVCLPYCFRASLASLQGFDTSLEEAGQSLGAGPVRSFLLITLPIVWSGVLSGWLFGFVVSFGELNTALFLTGPGVVTLPIEIFSYLQFQGSQLVIAAASTLQVAMIMVAVIAVERIIGVARIVQR
jgi:putative spermidine/putrescine transport system permease protein